MCCRGCSRIGSLKDSRALLEALAPSPWPKPFSKRLQDCCHRQGYKLSCASLQGTKCAGTCHMAMDSIWQQPPLVNLPRVYSYEHRMHPQTRYIASCTAALARALHQVAAADPCVASQAMVGPPLPLCVTFQLQSRQQHTTAVGRLAAR